MKELPFSISPSSTEYADCQFYWKLRKDGTVSEGKAKSLPLLVGNFIHEVLENYVGFLALNKPFIFTIPGAADDKDIFKLSFEHAWGTFSLPESMHDELYEILLGFAETIEVDKSTIWAVEKQVALSWDLQEVPWDSPEKWLRVKLDRVDIYPGDATVLIEDYKSQYYIPSESELRKRLQSQIYPFVMSVLNPYLEVFIMRYSFVRWNKRVDLEYSRADMDSIEHRLKSFTERMLKKWEDPNATWQAIPGDVCAICDLECPLVTQGHKPIRTIEDAREAGRRAVALERDLDRLVDDIKKFAKETPVDIEAGIYGYHPTETWRGFKADKLAEWGLEKGISLNSILSASTKGIKEIMKADPDMLGAELKKMAKLSVSTRFGFKVKNQKEEEDE